MRIGTTPTHVFTLPLDVDSISCLRLLYRQAGELILVKHTDECELSGNTVSVTLTQEETFKFQCKKPIDIQIRILDKEGKAFATKIVRITAEECLDCEVLA